MPRKQYTKAQNIAFKAERMRRAEHARHLRVLARIAASKAAAAARRAPKALGISAERMPPRKYLGRYGYK